MDRAEAVYLNLINPFFIYKKDWVGSRVDFGVEVLVRTSMDQFHSADLGSSSNYCSLNLQD